MIGLVSLFLVCLLLSAFFSGAEMAFVSSNRVKMRKFADSGDPTARRMIKIYQQPQHLLTTLLIGNNAVNIAATAICTYVLSAYFQIENEWIVTAVLTPVLLILGEMVPKDYCRLRAHTFLLRFALILDFIFKSCYGLSQFILKLIDFFLLPFGATFHKSIFVSEEEFRSLIEESTKSGVVGQHEKKIIDTILNFEKTHVENVMMPVAKVPSVEIYATVGEVKKVAAKTRTRMLLVYEEIPSIVMGMVYVFDLLFEEQDDLQLRKFLRSPIFLSRNTSIEKAFFSLQQKRQSYALVMDEAREIVGVVSIENLIGI